MSDDAQNATTAAGASAGYGSHDIGAATVVEPAPVGERGPEVVAQSAGPGALIPDQTWSRACDAWIADHIRSSPVAQAAEAWNHLMQALPHLKGFVETELRR